MKFKLLYNNKKIACADAEKRQLRDLIKKFLKTATGYVKKKNNKFTIVGSTEENVIYTTFEFYGFYVEEEKEVVFDTDPYSTFYQEVNVFIKENNTQRNPFFPSFAIHTLAKNYKQNFYRKALDGLEEKTLF